MTTRRNVPVASKATTRRFPVSATSSPPSPVDRHVRRAAQLPVPRAGATHRALRDQVGVEQRNPVAAGVGHHEPTHGVPGQAVRRGQRRARFG